METINLQWRTFRSKLKETKVKGNYVFKVLHQLGSRDRCRCSVSALHFCTFQDDKISTIKTQQTAEKGVCSLYEWAEMQPNIVLKFIHKKEHLINNNNKWAPRFVILSSSNHASVGMLWANNCVQSFVSWIIYTSKKRPLLLHQACRTFNHL